jgi:hypothetical protein
MASMDEMDPMASSTNEETTETGDAGFRRAGRRALAPAERRAVRGRARWLWAMFAGAVLAFWLVLFFAVGTGVFIEEAQGTPRVIAILVTALLFAGTIALLLAARCFLGDSRALARDARRGYVQRYAGNLPPADGVDPRLHSLLESGLLKRDRAAPQWLEVLPHSGFLWQVNDARPRRWIPFLPPQPIEVAETPAFAAVAAQWTEPVSGDGTPVRAGQRELSPDEVRELRQQLRRALRVRLVLAIPCNLWFWTVLGLGLREGHLPRPSGWAFWHDAVSFLLLGVVAILGDLVLVRGLREAWLHAREARIGQVVILRSPLVEDEAPEEAPAAWITLELLPLSEAVWTIDGEPAGWRMIQ